MNVNSTLKDTWSSTPGGIKLALFTAVIALANLVILRKRVLTKRKSLEANTLRLKRVKRLTKEPPEHGVNAIPVSGAKGSLQPRTTHRSPGGGVADGNSQLGSQRAEKSSERSSMGAEKQKRADKTISINCGDFWARSAGQASVSPIANDTTNPSIVHPSPAPTLRLRLYPSADGSQSTENTSEIPATTKEQHLGADATQSNEDGSSDRKQVRVSPTSNTTPKIPASHQPPASTPLLDDSSSLPHLTRAEEPLNVNRSAPSHDTTASSSNCPSPVEKRSHSTSPRHKLVRSYPHKPQAPRLPGGMEITQLLEVLEAGAEATYETLMKIAGKKVSENYPGPIPDACRLWWNAAKVAGRQDLASVVADALGLHLGSFEDDLWSTAEDERAQVLLAFLGTSPPPAMVRHVFHQNPAAGRAAMHLAFAPLRIQKDAKRRQRAAMATHGVHEAGKRIDILQPLSGLEDAVGLLRSSAGSAALAITLGLEAANQYGHGAEFEEKSILGPLLGALSCVLSIGEHVHAANSGVGSEGFQSQHSSTPIAHQLARSSLELSNRRSVSRGHVAQHRNTHALVSRNRQCLVEVVGGSLFQL